MASRTWRGALAAVVLAGCGPGQSQWQASLAAARAERLVGVWIARLRVDRVTGDSLPPVTGQIGLTLNEEGRRVAQFGERPTYFGTFDIDLATAGISAAAAGIPALTGRLRGDTLELSLGPQSDSPVLLMGILVGDSVGGRWTAHQRAGADRSGSFVLRRH